MTTSNALPSVWMFQHIFRGAHRTGRLVHKKGSHIGYLGGKAAEGCRTPNEAPPTSHQGVFLGDRFGAVSLDFFLGRTVDSMTFNNALLPRRSMEEVV
jgi:hypothetical protein